MNKGGESRMLSPPLLCWICPNTTRSVVTKLQLLSEL